MSLSWCRFLRLWLDGHTPMSRMEGQSGSALVDSL